MPCGGIVVLRKSFVSTVNTRNATTALQERLNRIGAMPNAVNEIVKFPNELERVLPPEIEELHRRAVEAGKPTYVDPRTGFTVFTRQHHILRGRCCGNHCRHCPYGHVNVLAKRRIATSFPPTDAGEVSLTDVESKQDPPQTPAPAHSIVYTKTGDKGTTSLFTGERRKKNDAVFEALGSTDELSSHIGLARAFLAQDKGKKRSDDTLLQTLEHIQQLLLNVGTILATPVKEDSNMDRPVMEIVNKYDFSAETKVLEDQIDQLDAKLPPLRVFILPGGGAPAAAQLHVCRTTCRRVERRMIDVGEQYSGYSKHLQEATVFVNRLSDFFFVAARSVAEEDILRTTA